MGSGTNAEHPLPGSAKEILPKVLTLPKKYVHTMGMQNNELLIASANTTAGFAIGIVKSSNYRTGAAQFPGRPHGSQQPLRHDHPP